MIGADPDRLTRISPTDADAAELFSSIADTPAVATDRFAAVAAAIDLEPPTDCLLLVLQSQTSGRVARRRRHRHRSVLKSLVVAIVVVVVVVVSLSCCLFQPLLIDPLLMPLLLPLINPLLLRRLTHFS